MARTKLTSGSSEDDATNFLTGGASAGEKSLVLLFVSSANVAFFNAPAVPTVTYGGEAMTRVNTVAIGDRRLSCFQFVTAQAKSGPFSINFNLEQQDYCAWSAFAYDGVDTAAPVGQSKVASANFSSTLTVTLAHSARNACAGAAIIDQAANVTPGAGLREVDEIKSNQNFGQRNSTLETLDAEPLVDDVSWTWPAAGNVAALVVEINVAAASTGTPAEIGPLPPHDHEPLIRRFEPILFLHADEKFFPVNAKRFVESATLWTNGTPPYDKKTWGNAPAGGGVFPRQPLETKLSAMPDEPGGTFLGALLNGGVDSAPSFLELGGWNDKALAHEAEVSERTTNVYADRGAIEVLYDGDLKDSECWYHAEVYSALRMDKLASLFLVPELRPVIATIKNPVLLCYYLFFPAHVQSVDCPSTSAIEVSSHAGDWQCFAIMLEGDGTTAADNYQPRYVGFTGSRPAAGADGYDAYAFDDAELTVLKVAPWTTAGPGVPAMPVTTARNRELHPHVYVSLGSHSLYPNAGDHVVDPYVEAAVPHDCGGSDSVAIMPPPPVSSSGGGGSGGSTSSGGGGADDDDDGDALDWMAAFGAFLLKLVSGATAGTAVGGPVGGVAGGWAGYVSGLDEFVKAMPLPPFGADTPPINSNGDTPKPDIGPVPGTGTTLTPAGLVVPEAAGTTAIAWKVKRERESNRRVYDFVVDRDKQFWWPNDDLERGYKGRWGQRVTDDTLPRRSGPRFPNYPRMFLLALADLATKKDGG